MSKELQERIAELKETNSKHQLAVQLAQAKKQVITVPKGTTEIANLSHGIGFYQGLNIQRAFGDLKLHVQLIQSIVLIPDSRVIEILLQGVSEKSRSAMMAADTQHFIDTYKRVFNTDELPEDILQIRDSVALLADLVSTLQAKLSNATGWQAVIKEIQIELKSWDIPYFDKVIENLQNINRGGHPIGMDDDRRTIADMADSHYRRHGNAIDWRQTQRAIYTDLEKIIHEGKATEVQQTAFQRMKRWSERNRAENVRKAWRDIYQNE